MSLLHCYDDSVQQGVVDAGGGGDVEGAIRHRNWELEVVRDPFSGSGGVEVEVVNDQGTFNPHVKYAFVGSRKKSFCKLERNGIASVGDGDIVGAEVGTGIVVEQVIVRVGYGFSWKSVGVTADIIGVGLIHGSVTAGIGVGAAAVDGQNTWAWVRTICGGKYDDGVQQAVVYAGHCRYVQFSIIDRNWSSNVKCDPFSGNGGK